MSNAILLRGLLMKSYLEMHEYMNASALSYFPDRPDLYKLKHIDGKEEPDTEALKIGRLTHTLFMEPHKYEQEYHLIPDSYINDKGNQLKWVERKGSAHVLQDIESAAGRCRIKSSHLEDATLYSESLDQNYEWLGPKLIEPTLLVKGGKLNFKSRPDILYTEIDVADNVKTSASINPEAFFRTAFDHGYDISAALTAYCYRKVFGRELKDYRFPVVEKSDTAPVKIFSSNQPMFGEGSMTFLQFGAKRLARCIESYLYCLDNNVWEPYANAPTGMKVPFGKYKEIIEDE